MAMAKRNEGSQGQLQHQRDPHGGRDAGVADHLHGDHPMLQHGVSVDMAKVNNPESMPDADKEDALLVVGHARRDGLLRHRQASRRPVDRQGERPPGQPGGQAGLRQGRRARPVRAVVEVVDNVRAAGVDQLGLLTEQRKTTAAPPRHGAAPAPSGDNSRDSRIFAARIRGELLWEWQWDRAAVRART